MIIQSRIAESKNTNLLNIFVTKKHKDSHVELSTSSTGFSFLIVTTNNKIAQTQLPSLKNKLTKPSCNIIAIKNLLNYPPISLSSLLGLPLFLVFIELQA